MQKHVPRELAETWRWMCPAGVYEIPEDAPEHGEVDVIVNLHQLRAVRGDHRQGRSADDSRGRRRTAVSDHLTLEQIARQGRWQSRAGAKLCGGEPRSHMGSGRNMCVCRVLRI